MAGMVLTVPATPVLYANYAAKFSWARNPYALPHGLLQSGFWYSFLPRKQPKHV